VEIRHLEWREHNIEKLLEHRISRREVEDLVRRDRYTIARRPEYPDQVRVTGPTSSGRWLTIALEDLGEGAYRPITGWDSTTEERQDYREKMQ
jgi:hypothetical protein